MHCQDTVVSSTSSVRYRGSNKSTPKQPGKLTIPKKRKKRPENCTSTKKVHNDSGCFIPNESYRRTY